MAGTDADTSTNKKGTPELAKLYSKQRHEGNTAKESAKLAFEKAKADKYKAEEADRQQRHTILTDLLKRALDGMKYDENIKKDITKLFDLGKKFERISEMESRPTKKQKLDGTEDGNGKPSARVPSRAGPGIH